MLRLIIIASLLLTLVFSVRGIILTWLADELPAAPSGKSEDSGDMGTAAGPRLKDVRSSLKLPDPMPDLHDGYLFTEERTLGEHTSQDAETEAQGPADAETQMDLKDLKYDGSIIIGEKKVALVTYPKTELAESGAAPSSPPTKQRPGAHTASPSLTGEKAHAMLAQGDTFGRYRVAEVAPDKIIFEKNNEMYEKLLYDPTKSRPTAPAPTGKPGGPPQSSPGQPAGAVAMPPQAGTVPPVPTGPGAPSRSRKASAGKGRVPGGPPLPPSGVPSPSNPVPPELRQDDTGPSEAPDAGAPKDQVDRDSVQDLLDSDTDIEQVLRTLLGK